MATQATSGPPAALGNIVPLGNADTIPEGSPPSSYAAYAVIEGEKGSVMRFAGLTLLRALLIAPGMALAGVQGRQLVLGSATGSGLISVAALGYAWFCRKQQAADQVGPLPTVDPPEVLQTEGEEVPQTQES